MRSLGSPRSIWPHVSYCYKCCSTLVTTTSSFIPSLKTKCLFEKFPVTSNFGEHSSKSKHLSTQSSPASVRLYPWRVIMALFRIFAKSTHLQRPSYYFKNVVESVMSHYKFPVHSTQWQSYFGCLVIRVHPRQTHSKDIQGLTAIPIAGSPVSPQSNGD